MIRIGIIHPVKSEPLVDTSGPFEVVHQCPCRVRLDIDVVLCDGAMDLANVIVVKANAEMIV